MSEDERGGCFDGGYIILTRKDLCMTEEESAMYKKNSPSMKATYVSAVPSAEALVIMGLKKPQLRDRTMTKSMKHAGDIAIDDVIAIAQIRSPWSKAKNFSCTVKEILGTCLSVGCTVDGEDPNKVITEIDNGDLELPEEGLLGGYSSMKTKEESALTVDPDNSYEEDEEDLGMTEEEKAMYQKSIKESESFDVIYFPSGVVEFGVIIPINIEREDVLFYTKMAIEVFNKSSHKEAEGELVFDKILKAMGQAICGLRYYLTFNAKNLRHNEIRTYQAVALCGAGRDDEVESFRAMPSGSKKEWFWVTHLSCCRRKGDTCGAV